MALAVAVALALVAVLVPAPAGADDEAGTAPTSATSTTSTTPPSDGSGSTGAATGAPMPPPEPGEPVDATTSTASTTPVPPEAAPAADPSAPATGRPGDEGFEPSYVGAPYFRPGAVYTQNFPDPSVVYDPGTDRYYAFATTTGGVNVPVMSSPDAVTWTARSNHGVPNAGGQLHDGLPDPSPSWVTYHTGDPNFPDDLWAPGVAKVGDRWAMFYALRLDAAGRRCIFYATSDRPDGPYLDPQQLHCGPDPLGSIDPQPFTDPATGTTYLVWQDMGLPDHHGQRIWARPIVATGSRTVGWAPGSEVTFLLESEAGWAGYVAENPSLTRLADGRLALFYSGGRWDSDGYSVGVAICPRFGFTWTPSCQRTTTEPFMNRRAGRKGIGGSHAFRGRGGQVMLANHSWDERYPSRYPDNQRRMLVERVHVVDGRMVVTGAPGPTGPAPAAGYQPRSPQRVLDTRDGTGTTRARRLEPREVLVLDLAGTVPASTTAVVLNLTAVLPSDGGFVTAYPCGTPPNASNLNFRPGQVVDALVTVQLNPSRAVCLYTEAATDLLADLQGTYDTAASSGVTGVAPARLLDTRTSGGPLRDGGVVEVQITGRGGVPAGATAAVVNLTAADARAGGWLAAWSCDGPRPLVSNVNHPAGAPAPNAAIVPLSARGTMCVYALRSTQVIVDAFGYVGGGGATFRARTPQRLLDTRALLGPARGGQVVELPVVGGSAAPPGTRSVVLTVTAVDASAFGWVAAYPCSSPPAPGQETSVLNVQAGETRAAHVTVSTGTDGKVCLYTLRTTHLVVDLAGGFG